jgi:hypothetical protein
MRYTTELSETAKQFIKEKSEVNYQYLDVIKRVDLLKLFELWLQCEKEDRDFSAEYTCDFYVNVGEFPEYESRHTKIFVAVNNEVRELVNA